jgi:Regulator of ribonuclease activity B
MRVHEILKLCSRRKQAIAFKTLRRGILSEIRIYRQFDLMGAACIFIHGAETMKYPDDANGGVLRRMEGQGDDLSYPRNIEFTVVFPNEEAAKQFADYFSALGYAASAELTETVKDFPWDVLVVKHMVPSHSDIGAFEDSLQRVADTFGGRNDGWGCLSSGSQP